MTNLVDRVARAISEAMLQGPASDEEWANLHPADKAAFHSWAEAAIAAQAIEAGTVKTASGLDGEATKARSCKDAPKGDQ